MPFTRTTFLKTLKIGSAVVIIILIIAYALWRSLNYARGPSLTLLQPSDFATINSTTTHVIGKIERANLINLNGKAVTVDEQGNFDETIVVFPGVNYLTLVAKDQFGRSVETKISVFRQ